MSSNSHQKWVPIFLILAAIDLGWIGFQVFAILNDTVLPINTTLSIGISLFYLVALFILLGILAKRGIIEISFEMIIISGLISVASIMVFSTIYQLSAYLSLPVDLLSFSESPFVNDILKLRMGVSIYTSPLDNNSYPYTPGAQILTYLISTALGQGDSIPFFRMVQFSFVVLAAVMAASLTDLLAHRGLSNGEYRNRPLWIVVWFLFLFLLTTDPQFNLYTQSLHNDGLALLITITGFWLIVKFSLSPKKWLLVMMAILPALGFLVKQNQLMWIGLFTVYLLGARLLNLQSKISWKQILFFGFSSIALVIITIGICYLIWGVNFQYWIFQALGDKQVSIPRSFEHLFWGGVYAVMGLFAGWLLVFRKFSKEMFILWFIWGLLFTIEVYTSGLGFTANHMGPGIVIAGSWFFVGVLKIWPKEEESTSWPQFVIQEVIAVTIVILLFADLGFVRNPINPVPEDFIRYVDQIEAEFQALPAENVLMDWGTWIYFRENVVMDDRAASVSLHVGINQPQINHSMLEKTIERITNKSYDKILARQLDTGATAYDFQDRGSGVKDAILNNYYEVRRIPEVEGIDTWWPPNLVSEIIVLIPNQ